MLAVPQHVPRLSITSSVKPGSSRHMLSHILADARPSFLEYEATMKADKRQIPSAEVACSVFELLSTTPSLRRYTLTLQGRGWSRVDDRQAMMDSCVMRVAAASLTHLLIKDPNKSFATSAGYADGDRPHSQVVELVDGELQSLATTLVKASSTLEWIGFWLPGYPLHVYRAKPASAGSGEESATVEGTLDKTEAERWAIFDATPVDGE
ncbi:hypothetical protein BN946_scf184862.g3 [Trametes cinnabarina]|uniref:Uncharacterized protein n=1 Tax=Pycnoporus cinnabarinus TaxID=5643 RepID=A0A060SK68_PYCCI|nr:hypothetical protein BN946_scf184862.g3 [Trametes cinnabarina]